jgi:rsbT co-antagonist protein RsbR
MSVADRTAIPAILEKHEEDLLAEWLRAQLAASTVRMDLLSEAELRQQSREFLSLLRRALQAGDAADAVDLHTPVWAPLRELLADISRGRAQRGFTPSETAIFVFSFKEPLFSRLRQEVGGDPEALADEVWTATRLLDSLGLYTAEVYLNSREEIIRRQQQELLELSTPVVRLWEGVVALPLIGALDSARTQIVMENLLESIVDTGAGIAIIDITGVPTVDTLVAQHLLKTVQAARLMGAECIISGIRPQIAQTIVHLGVTLNVTTKATLADAIALSFRQLGLQISRGTPGGPAGPARA